jgi:Na+/H+ antiporter NhaD/arsenite permease-like protein
MPVPVEFLVFGLVLLGVALAHRYALWIALGGAVVLTTWSLIAVPGFDLGHHLGEEWRILVNLFGLIVGFALLADHFEGSGVPDRVPRVLPRGAVGAFVLLALVFVLSGFLDNIAAAMIGGVAAKAAFGGRVRIGYVAAIVAASNAGGAGSVVGDTTTTMMWIAGIPAVTFLAAYLPAFVALLVAGSIASVAQARTADLVVPTGETHPIDKPRLVVVGLILAGAIVANVSLDFPALGVWVALLLTVPWRAPRWAEVPAAAKGASFLVALVFCASLMPVKALPPAGWTTALGLGLVSSVFDNIPLTKLALQQGGYDWALLAFAVGYGGSLTWFGSSAGVAISKTFPEARRLGRYLLEGWPVLLGYLAGFFAYLGLVGWRP